jgi:hypothetical protein
MQCFDQQEQHGAALGDSAISARGTFVGAMIALCYVMVREAKSRDQDREKGEGRVEMRE